MKTYFHLPGLFEFYDFYRLFLPLFHEHRDYFFDGTEIGSIYGAPGDCLWGGGRVGFGDADAKAVKALLAPYGISARLTFSNSLLKKEHLSDKKCLSLCELFADTKVKSGVIVHSDLLLETLRQRFPSFYFVSSTTKVLTDFSAFRKELGREDFRFVVPDFRLNHKEKELLSLSEPEKAKVEFLVNECCDVSCTERRACYENVSRKSLGEDCPDHVCRAEGAKGGYRFSKAMKSPAFISRDDMDAFYLPNGFSHYKIEGRSLGSAMLLEFLLYYMTKPAYHIHVREAMYLDSSLDLF